MIYTAGYLGHTVDDLYFQVETLGALLVDIRLSPSSRLAEWNKDALRVKFGDRYAVCPHWGNLNYRQETRPRGFHIANFDAGYKLFRYRLEKSGADSAILICACRAAETCHRAVVAAKLLEIGEEVCELEW